MTDGSRHGNGSDQHAGAHRPPAVTPQEWDAWYAERDQLWSGQPNGALVAEVAGLVPGRALDVGCGEGADAVWLARRGWQVTALDVSQVALHRGAAAARDAGVAVSWVCSGLLGAELGGTFDLVSAQYPVLRRTPDAVAERTLLSAVAPGGTLLFVHHAFDEDEHGAGGFALEDHVGPADVAAVLDDAWQVEVDERRPRSVSGGAGVHHVEDVVLRARRRS